MLEPFILFQVAGTTYGVRSAFVQQVEMVENITPVPNTLPFVEGIVFLRGQVVPVINLRERFGLEKIPYDVQTRLIVINLEGRVVGMTADLAREFVQVDENEIKLPPDSLTGPSVAYLEGIVSLQERLVLVVNLARLLDTQEQTGLNGVFEQQSKPAGSVADSVSSAQP